MDEVLNKLDAINTKLDICCGNYDKLAEKIQSVYRGHLGRDIAKIERRSTIGPNVTDALLDMPKDFGDVISERVIAIKSSQMPESDIIVPAMPPRIYSSFGRPVQIDTSGLPLHEAFLKILSAAPNYNIEIFSKVLCTIPQSDDTLAAQRGRRQGPEICSTIQQFAKDFKEWYDNNRDLEGGGKKSKKKSKKKKKSKQKPKRKSRTKKRKTRKRSC